MHLSKQEFSKLSKKDQNKIMNGRSKPKNNKRKTKKGPGKQVASPMRPSKLSSAPVAIGRQNRMPKPMMRTNPNGDCRIKHREYLKDIVAQGSSPSVFISEGFPINPGMSNTFPWLSQIAPRFEKYRFDKLHFAFETEAPTSLGGSLILTVDYDASDAPPGSKVQAMAYKNAVRSAPWEECCHQSAHADLTQQKAYFVRSGGIPASTDIKLYDVGNLFVCSQNVVTGGATLGELYVEYDILLQTPQLQLPSTLDVETSSIQSNSGSSLLFPFGTNPTINNSQITPLFTYDSLTARLTFNKAGSFGGFGTFTGVAITNFTLTGSLGVVAATATNQVINSAGTLCSLTMTAIPVQIGDTLEFAITATSCAFGIFIFTDMVALA